ncbi:MULTISPECIES: gamma-glutamyl-gamma-aminobutyrate hydrolase family protein [Sediminimonas]|uniref:gamma-glutamyl-gamma-aminobutyrate hydrolase family protein n=1 Tax=Sediminimonas TaxID=659427 RepID=UPI00042A336A|nr:MULTISPECIES: gamma-glutamyl-gamma-aminobutyrate hydrolase family protein [Sediminimonas]MDR9486015.1 gamma-glutamyl-gamma-aminobutyrate hydrolase family protein [Sediminimonas sp.]
MTRPLIGVTVSRRSGWRIFPLIAFNIWMAGGRARRWSPGDHRPDVADVDGLVIGGGDDISPDLYGGRLVTSARLDHDRDALEQRLVRDATKAGLPVLGICRGSQMINVALGGTLHQDAYGTYTASDRRWTILPRKIVHLEAGSLLSALAGAEPMTVNALHSQSVDSLGKGLRVAARDRGGMIQAIERDSDPFAIGVQWHPEHLFYARRQQALFRALVRAARAHDEARGQLQAVHRDA